MRLHVACGIDVTPRRAERRGADEREREVAIQLLPRCQRGGETVVCGRGYVGRDFEAAVARIGAAVVRPARKDEPAGSRPHLGRIRQRNRVGPSDPQGRPLLGAPGRPHARGPPDPRGRAHPGPCRERVAQTHARPSDPQPGRLRGVGARNQSSRRSRRFRRVGLSLGASRSRTTIQAPAYWDGGATIAAHRQPLA
jgi:hypothetical protein